MTAPDRISDPRRQGDLLLFRLHRIQTTAGRLVVQLCESEFGITRREWRVLSVVHDHEGVLSSELAEHATLDRARTSRALTSLAAKRLVLRQPRPSDRREVHVFLTDEGRQLHAAILPRVIAINLTLVEGLDSAQRHQLDQLVDALQAQASRAVAAARTPLHPPEADAG